MSGRENGEVDPFLASAVQRAGQIEAAVVHLAKAMQLHLVDSALDPDSHTAEDVETLADLTRRLAQITGVSRALLGDVAAVVDGPPVVHAEVTTVEPVAVSAPARLISPIQTAPALPVAVALPPASATAAPASIAQPPRPTPPPRPQGDRFGRGASAAETGQSDEVEMLYRRVIDPSRQPAMRPVAPGEAIRVTIVADNTIQIGEQSITLSRNQLFLFNALMLRRGICTSRELRAFGFLRGRTEGTVKTTFSQTMAALLELLDQVPEVKIITRIGSGFQSKYAVNPKLVLVDMRRADGSVVGQSDNTGYDADGGSKKN